MPDREPQERDGPTSPLPLAEELVRRVTAALAEYGVERMVEANMVDEVILYTPPLDDDTAWRAMETARVGLLTPICRSCQQTADDSYYEGVNVSPREFCCASRPFVSDCGAVRAR